MLSIQSQASKQFGLLSNSLIYAEEFYLLCKAQMSADNIY
jgi:hypothetical protein